jgi:tetratricopeptide (TPR) repeat protein
MSVWSQSYDRELSDVFMLQSEIARQVVNSIDASLIPAAQAQPTGVHTENLEAYDLYLQAKQYMQWRMGPSKVELLRADALLERALALDAGFAAAHASLSRVSSAMVFRGFDRSESRTALAESAADRALQLDPELAEAHLAKGLYIYRVLRDYPAALGELQVARELAPGEAEILSWIGTIWKRQGKFESAANILQRALRMDPYNPTVPAELAIVYRSMGEFSQALDATDKAIALNPSFRAKLSRVNLLERWTGDLAPRRQLLEESGPGHRFQWAVLHAQERRFAEALATLDSIRADRADSPQESLAAAVLRARIFWARGESAAQHQTSEEALSIIEAQQVEDIHMQRGIAYALLGREEEALRESALALQENPPTLDVLRASDMAFSMAFIHAVLGNVPEAVQWLEQSHQLARSFTAQFLKIDFLWDPIRNHPEFRSFMRRLETNS